MKNIFFNILIGCMVFLLFMGCGDNNSSLLEEIESTSVKISIRKIEDNKIFNKQTLNIKHMQVEVYTAIDNIDESYLDKTPIQVGEFSKVLSEWQISLSDLEKNKYYIFVVRAFSSEQVDISSLIFKGISNHQIIEGSNSININLTQTSNADRLQNLPSVTNMVINQLADNTIELSFNISNPYEEALKWEIQDDTTKIESTNFSTNVGETNLLTTTIKVNYLETNSNNYFLLLSTDDAVVSYHFAINIEEENETVAIRVEIAPIITKLVVNITGTDLFLKPELDKIASTYAWEIVENLGSTISIDDASISNIRLSEYTETSEFKIKLTVTSSSGAFSYRIYHIFGNYRASTDVVIPPILTESANLKKTGQTKSYDYLGDEENIKDDGFYKKGYTPSYTRDTTTQIVTDNVTTLMWQDDNDTQLDWVHANNYCNNATLGDFSDWRLPSMRELDTIITHYPTDPLNSEHKKLLDEVFKNRGRYLWSSYIYQGYQNTDKAWFYDLLEGYYADGKGSRGSEKSIRCVRGTLVQPSFNKNISTGIVKDSVNNLEWQDNGVFVNEKWQDAVERCDELSLGNKDDWRLPNINELNSIINRRNTPLVDVAFTTKPSFGHSLWSATSRFNHPSYAYTVTYLSGASGTLGFSDKEAYTNDSRCVRDVLSINEN